MPVLRMAPSRAETTTRRTPGISSAGMGAAATASPWRLRLARGGPPGDAAAGGRGRRRRLRGLGPRSGAAAVWRTGAAACRAWLAWGLAGTRGRRLRRRPGRWSAAPPPWTRARKSLPRRGGAARGSEGRMGPSSLEGGGGERERRCEWESARRPCRFRYGFGYGAAGGPGGGGRPASGGRKRQAVRGRAAQISPNCEPGRNASMRGEATPHPSAAAARPDRMRPSKHQGGTGNAGHHPPFGVGHRRRGAGRPGPWPRPRNPAASRAPRAARCGVTPEAGASLRIIRPARFVEPDEVVFRANAQRFQLRFPSIPRPLWWWCPRTTT